ncbi:MAG: class I SAM-dependent methyltransferase [Gemmataceae bacterium]|nr:class I SAM-dependent methyltransferase [Gemmataceae bacterium]
MARRKKNARPDVLSELVVTMQGKLQLPLGVVLGSPREAADLVETLVNEDLASEDSPVICYQMDLYQAERLSEELAERDVHARVESASDLWDLTTSFGTLLYPVPEGGERALKLDMLEQAYHTLRPHGRLVTLSPYSKDQFLPSGIKKVFGRAHTPEGAVFWGQRDGDRPRRRHEVTFHVSRADAPSLVFVSRPGTFSYGRFDDGARALVETAEIQEGDHILDIGCGCGTNGVIAGLRAGPEGHVTFVDSNMRAVALAEHNARTNGLRSFHAVANTRAEGVPAGSLNVVLANPPYHAQGGIAQLFIDRGAELLKPGGRFYLVTRQPDQVGPLVAERFGTTRVEHRRGYTVLCAERQAR